MRLAILGCGLLGASIAAAARERTGTDEIVGFDLPGAAVDAARASGVFDTVHSVSTGAVSPGAVSTGAISTGGLSAGDASDDNPRFDLGVVAVPPAHLAAGVRSLAPHAAALFDVGSVKANLLTELGAEIPSHFVPCHPMAGSERQGAAAADPDLFVGRSVLITPTSRTDSAALDQIAEFWRSLGAIPHEMDATAHDAAVAYTSHLPHLLAFAYMGLTDVPSAAAGPGFRDFSRLAAANPVLWSDILRSNRSAWRPLLETYIDRVRDLQALLEDDDAAATTAYLAARAAQRAGFDLPEVER